MGHVSTALSILDSRRLADMNLQLKPRGPDNHHSKLSAGPQQPRRDHVTGLAKKKERKRRIRAEERSAILFFFSDLLLFLTPGSLSFFWQFSFVPLLCLPSFTLSAYSSWHVVLNAKRSLHPTLFKSNQYIHPPTRKLQSLLFSFMLFIHFPGFLS